MKRLIFLCTAALLGLGVATQAAAGPGFDRGGRNFDRGPGKHYRPPMHQQHRHYAPPPRQHHYPHHDRRYRHDWVGPAAVLTIGGVALGSALYYNRPPTVIYQNTAPGGSWFYCRSSGQYYPYTQACPEGWVAVPPR